MMSGEGQAIGQQRLRTLMQRGTEFLGCDIAILGGAMSWISERNLVSAISNAGGFGVIACGAMVEMAVRAADRGTAGVRRGSVGGSTSPYCLGSAR